MIDLIDYFISVTIEWVQLQKLPIFLQKRQDLFEIYKGQRLNLMNGADAGIIPARFRAILHCNDPGNLIALLASVGIKAIIPIEGFELLDQSHPYPEALKLTKSLVSLPCYPSLTQSNAYEIAQFIKKFL